MHRDHELSRRRHANFVKSLASFLVLFFVAMQGALAQPTGVLFTSDFEEADIDGNWGLNVTTRVTIVSDPGPHNRVGNHVARLRVPAGRGGTGIYKVLSSGQRQLYARWYQKWEAGYDFNAACHNFTYHAGNVTSSDPTSCMGCSDNRPNGDDWFSAWLEPCAASANEYRRPHFYAYYRGMYMDCSNPVGSCFGDHFPCMLSDIYCTKPEDKPRPGKLPPQMDVDRWYCFETLVDAGTPTSDPALANGVLNFWIDGAEYGPFSGLWLRTSANVLPIVFWLGLFHHDVHSVEGYMVDDIVVSTAPIGCSNQVSLSPPTNLRVVP